MLKSLGLRGIVHPKNTKEYILVSKQLTVAIHFNGYGQLFANQHFQNIFFCVKQNKETTGTTRGWVNYDRIFNFCVSYPFKTLATT